MKSLNIFTLVASLSFASATTEAAFALPSAQSAKRLSRVRRFAHADDQHFVSRRNWLVAASSSSLAVLSTTFTTPLPAFAAASQEETDKANIVKGYKNLQYLLDNWEKETTVCKTGGDNDGKRCERTPIKVMEYMGYKSTENPLFKADKAMKRLYPLAPADRDDEFLNAIEQYAENAEEASGMAYISSWGEANPGGGKDRVALFIERARNNVVASRDSLATVISILGLKA
jgi:hypothetical protein